jgi:outer membrane lipoprotein LolB
MKVSFIVILVLLITACSPVSQLHPVENPDLVWQMRQQQLHALTQWQIQGRAFIQQKSDAWNVGLRWQQHNNNYQIKLLGPFAQGGINLDGDPERVILTLDDGRQFMANSAEDLLTEAFSWQLPISALQDWVRGLPYAKQDYQELQLDPYGRISYLSQQGWQVKFLRYGSFGIHSVPEKIFISHPDLDIRIVISSWDIPS